MYRPYRKEGNIMRKKISPIFITFLLLAVAIPIGFELVTGYFQQGISYHAWDMRDLDYISGFAELDVDYVYQAVSKTELQMMPFERGEAVYAHCFNPSLEGTYYTVISDAMTVQVFKEPDVNFAIEDIINYDELVAEYESEMIRRVELKEEATKGYRNEIIAMIVVYLIATVVLFAFFSSLYAVISDRIKKRKAKRIEND